MSGVPAALVAALAAAERGWPVFPMRPGTKHPATHGDTPEHPCPRTGRCRDTHQGWEQLATTNPDHITAYARSHPDSNWAIATGPAGLLVIDLDVAKPGKPLPPDCKRWGAVHGAQMLSRLIATAGHPLPDTRTVATPSGGTHLYYAQPAGTSLGNSKAKLAGLIDTRGHGGCVLLPGSRTPDGAYELIVDRDPATLPAWLVHRLAERPAVAVSAPRRMAAANINTYLDTVITREQHRVATAPPGTHNKAQMAAGLALGNFVGNPDMPLDYDTALHHLLQSAQDHITGGCGCTERGVLATFRWALTAGARNPRQLTLDTPERGDAA